MFVFYRPAHIAATNVTGDCLWLLSLKRANFETKNSKGETPIHLACKSSEDGNFLCTILYFYILLTMDTFKSLQCVQSTLEV